MPTLPHPRPDVMNHQPPGPTCFMSCVVAVIEYYNNAVLANRDGKSPVQWMYDNFMKYHAPATDLPGYTKLALQHGGQHYDGEMRLLPTTDAMQIFRNVITLKISNRRPVLCAVTKTGARYGHLFMIYGYTLPDTVWVADPIIGLKQISIHEIQSGYNGNGQYHWTKMFFTKR